MIVAESKQHVSNLLPSAVQRLFYSTNIQYFFWKSLPFLFEKLSNSLNNMFNIGCSRGRREWKTKFLMLFYASSTIPSVKSDRETERERDPLSPKLTNKLRFFLCLTYKSNRACNINVCVFGFRCGWIEIILKTKFSEVRWPSLPDCAKLICSSLLLTRLTEKCHCWRMGSKCRCVWECWREGVICNRA